MHQWLEGAYCNRGKDGISRQLGSAVLATLVKVVVKPLRNSLLVTQGCGFWWDITGVSVHVSLRPDVVLWYRYWHSTLLQVSADCAGRVDGIPGACQGYYEGWASSRNTSWKAVTKNLLLPYKIQSNPHSLVQTVLRSLYFAKLYFNNTLDHRTILFCPKLPLFVPHNFCCETTCNIRPCFRGHVGGFKIDGPLYTCIMQEKHEKDSSTW